MKISLRELKIEDAERMLKWMHTETVTKYLNADFSTKNLDDCLLFIESSKEQKRDIHLAIVNNADEYLGTVSLKNIIKQTAEFAIVLSDSVFGLGVAKEAMKLILDYGRKELNLKDIYWCVSPLNKRAVSFYDKNGYTRIDYPRFLPLNTNYSRKQIEEFIWYNY